MSAETIAAKATLKVSSPEFKHMENIPEKYTCEGYNVSPPLAIDDIPKGAISMVLIVEDPDAPGGIFDHWIVWNIQPTEVIGEGTAPGVPGKNSRGQNKYAGPCPPSGTHRYLFKIYALDTMLDLKDDADKRMVEQAIQNHILAYGELIGLYKKKA